MKIKPITFSGPMVRAIIDGRKTQTRVPINPRPHLVTWDRKDVFCRVIDDPNGDAILASGDEYPASSEVLIPIEPRYRAGDVLWVREKWANVGAMAENEIVYEADDPDGSKYGLDSWHSASSMPLWACRLWLRVTDVRVHRVQEIGGGDAIAEGYWMRDDPSGTQTPIEWFREQWDAINAKRGYGWDANPWVWAYTFERTENPEVVA